MLQNVRSIAGFVLKIAINKVNAAEIVPVGQTHLNVNQRIGEHSMVYRMILCNVVDSGAKQRFEMCFIPRVRQLMLNDFQRMRLEVLLTILQTVHQCFHQFCGTFSVIGIERFVWVGDIQWSDVGQAIDDDGLRRSKWTTNQSFSYSMLEPSLPIVQMGSPHVLVRHSATIGPASFVDIREAYSVHAAEQRWLWTHSDRAKNRCGTSCL